jgi:cysteine desulfurase family protein (TIGR01976 family)
MQATSFDVARVRGLYPTVGRGTVHLDGSYSALQPESVVRAIIATLRFSPTQPGSRSPRSQRAATSIAQARLAVADLVGATPDCVVLGHTVAGLIARFAVLLSRDWQFGDEVVLNRFDADMNLEPWLRAARSAGGVVRWAEVDLETGELPAWQYEELIGRRTRIVTVALGNPATGSVPDVRAIADLAHRHGALVVVDAGAAVAHLPIDLGALGADLLAVSAPAFGGPTVAALVARPGLLHEMDADPHLPVPQRFEVSPLPVELLDGLTAAVEHLADLDERVTGDRRHRVVSSLTAAAAHAGELYARVDEGLREMPGVTVLGTSRERLPVAAFTVARSTPAQLGDALARQGIALWTGPSGMAELMSAFGTDELGGAVFLGLMPYTNAGEIEHLLDALGTLVRA